MALDENVRNELKELGSAINEAISVSPLVHEILERIRELGQDPYLILDVTVALEHLGERTEAALPSIRRGSQSAHRKEAESASFQINVKDLKLLKSLGIDPTRPVRARRRSTAAFSSRSKIVPKD
ncbi:MAG: hypothetical protein IT186_20385 [Acidobacteria bacterium]|nr:hypothetical protein [Acidobacteriota bacterium]MCG3194484.1 hypothetical protein [Thermoanaerobaculia bacterium]MCK6683099.1 hypothetical protein [Thermoanaerobaculia bacterium]